MMLWYPVVAKLPEILPQENYYVTKSFLFLVYNSESLLKLLSFLIHLIFPKTTSQPGFIFTSHFISTAYHPAILSTLHHLLSLTSFSQL